MFSRLCLRSSDSCLSVSLCMFVCLSACQSVSQPVSLCLFLCLSVDLSGSQSVSVVLFVCLSAFFVCLFVSQYLPFCLSVSLSVKQSVFVCQSACLLWPTWQDQNMYKSSLISHFYTFHMLPEVLDNDEDLLLIKVVFSLKPTVAVLDRFQIETLWEASVFVNL